ncbi:hypothetical protein QQS21_008094 [Conoideocrella luteorostrata]|uniref:Major facilitator superfamily (MFS) profile domain-containing protein n=1 Tax=Conoideocrella luteorostrata TaxID=1105319 RepID=A0AAJ0CJV2_9HYPO|nr:hypothetical protein QQS21_008094 [Conoideocrella luteorostrata]
MVSLPSLPTHGELEQQPTSQAHESVDHQSQTAPEPAATPAESKSLSRSKSIALVAAVITPFVPNEAAFHIFRALQGIGAAANVPTAIGVLGTTFSKGKARTYAFGFYSASTPLGSVFGNLLSGFIASFTSWKWVFGVIAILAACITIAGHITIPAPKAVETVEKIRFQDQLDWLGAFLVTAGLACLLFALSTGNDVGWSTPWIPVLIALSVGLVTAFVFWERYLEPRYTNKPLIKISIFKTRKFSVSMAVMATLFASFNGYLVYATIFYQDYQALSALQTTLRFIPTGVTGVVMAIAISPLLVRIPTFIVLLVGAVCTSLSSLLFAVPIPVGTSYFSYGLVAMVLATFGADTVTPSLYLIVSHSLSDDYQAIGGALLNVAMQLGRVIGLALATATQTAVMAQARGLPIEHAGHIKPGDHASLLSIRAASWLNFAFGASSFFIVLAFFTGSGIIGQEDTRTIEPSQSERN